MADQVSAEGRNNSWELLHIRGQCMVLGFLLQCVHKSGAKKKR